MRIIHLAAILFFSFNGFAQIEIFEPNETHKLDTLLPKNKHVFVLSVNPTTITRGLFGLYPELGINEYLVIKAGLGITTKDYLYEMLQSNTSNTAGMVFATEGMENRSTRFGYFFDINFKFFPSEYDSDLEGFYLSPGLRYRSYRSDLTLYKNSGYYSPFPNSNDEESISINSDYKMWDPNFKLGYWRTSEIIDNLVFDIYYGLGASVLHRNGYVEIVDNNNMERSIKAVSQTRYRLLPFWGISVGYAF